MPNFTGLLVGLDDDDDGDLLVRFVPSSPPIRLHTNDFVCSIFFALHKLSRKYSTSIFVPVSPGNSDRQVRLGASSRTIIFCRQCLRAAFSSLCTN